MNKKKSVYVIAEAGVNHNGQKDLAFELITQAAESGADAVKFQTFKATRLAHASLEKAAYQKLNTNQDESQQAMLQQLELPDSWYEPLKAHAASLGITFLSTAFDIPCLQFLQTLDLPMYKIPSGELTNGPLLWHFGRIRKPLIVSTGMATLSEVEQALAILNHAFQHDKEPQSLAEIWACWSDETSRADLSEQVTLLHCTSQYPTPWEEVNLNAMTTLAAAFGMRVGYSDHTEGTIIPIAAVAKGAVLIEKHLTLDRTLPGPDHRASIEPDTFKEMVTDIRALTLALGSGIKAPQVSEFAIKQVARQSLVAGRAIAAGKTWEPADLTTARIGLGISPAYYWDLLGSVASKAYETGELIEL